MPDIDKEASSVRATCEEIGEEAVSARVSAGNSSPWNERKRGFAQEWLKEREKLREDKKHQENLDVAKSARNAAWVAGICAIVAALCAVAAFFF